MSSTNSTSNYELSQFLGTDKPAWLTDYNSDMSKIDTGIHNAQSTATSADGKATTNASAIGTLANLTTTEKSNLVGAVNEVNTVAGTASSVASGAGTTATQAKNKADALEAYLTLNTVNTVTFTASAGEFQTGKNSMSIRTNASKSLGKFYGDLLLISIPNNLSEITITSSDTGIRPSTAITFNGCCQTRIQARSTVTSYRQVPQSYTLNTNGTITATLSANDANTLNVNFLAVLLFITDFGDVPVSE